MFLSYCEENDDTGVSFYQQATIEMNSTYKDMTDFMAE